MLPAPYHLIKRPGRDGEDGLWCPGSSSVAFRLCCPSINKQFVNIHNAVQHRDLVLSFLWEGHVPSTVSPCQGAATLVDLKAFLLLRTASHSALWAISLSSSFKDCEVRGWGSASVLLIHCRYFPGNGQQHLWPLGVRSTLCQAVTA